MLDVLNEKKPISVPVDGADKVIRSVISKRATRKVMQVLRDEPQEWKDSWQRWYKALGDKQKSGDIYQAAEVVRDLTYAQNRKGISPAFQRMLSQTRQTLIGEIAVVLDMDQEAAVGRVDRALEVSAKPAVPAPKPAPKKKAAKKPAPKKKAAKKPVAKKAKKAPAKKGAAKKPAPRRVSRFSVGDKVAHPQHGVAVITDVRQIELDGEKREYFVLDIFIEQLTVSVPKDSVDQAIRPVISKTAVSRVLRVLRDEPQDAGSNWSRWYKVLGEKKDSGDIYQVAEVVRDLTHSQNRKGISPALKRMLSKSRQILTGEIAFALNVEQEEAVLRVDKALPLSESRS